jgi:hypothetical protein
VGKCDLAAQIGGAWGLQPAVVRQYLGDEMVADGMKMGGSACVEFMVDMCCFLHLHVI